MSKEAPWLRSTRIKPITPSFLCFNSRMVPNPSGDHHCSATLVGEIIHYNVVDGLGLQNGVQMEQIKRFNFNSTANNKTSVG